MARSCMIRQTLTAKCVKTGYSFGLVVDIETNRASKMLLEVFQKGLHRHASLGKAFETEKSQAILVSEKTVL